METTHKTLTLILLITLILTILGTYSSLQRISGLKSLTGAWENGSTTRGSVNLSIASSVNINFTQDRVNFGSGFVTPGQAACFLETSIPNPNCGWTYTTNMPPLLLENQGNTNVILNLSNLNTSQSLIGGTRPGYAWRWAETEGVNSTTCTNGTIFMQEEGIFRNITVAYENNVNSSLCRMFNASDANDVINISFKLLVPNDAIAETGKFDTWTATATAV